MIVELICVGTELLLGNIVNTNAAYLSEKCAEAGLSCFYQTVVGDNEKRLTETVKTAMSRADIIILSGGLGPTQDDLTKEVVAELLKLRLIMDDDSKDRIQEIFEKRNLEITVNNWKQALVPEGCIVLANENGTAPGIIVKEDNKSIILLPGPPNELVPMFEEKVVPYLKTLETSVIYSRTVKICGLGESKAETMVKDLIDAQDNPSIAPYAKTGEVHFRVTAKADSEKEAHKIVSPVVNELRARFGDSVYTTDPEITLEMSVISLLKEHDMSLAIAESCTGGLLSARLVNVEGASRVFKTGIITYSNKSKRKLLGVKKSILDEFGAVSEQTAEKMAKGILKQTQADVSIAVTGIAGPSGGSPEKPVGLVFIACCVKGTTTVKKYNFSGNRAKIRESAVAAAITLLRKCVLKEIGK